LLAVVVWSWDVGSVPAPHDHNQQNQALPNVVLNTVLFS